MERPARAPLAEPRFRLLETIRQYATDQLEQTDGTREADQAPRRRHSDYYLALARQAEPELYRDQQGQWLAMLELEHDNIRLALSRLATEPERSTDLLQMVVDLRRFWHVHNHHQECLSYLQPTLDEPNGRTDRTIVRRSTRTGGRNRAHQ